MGRIDKNRILIDVESEYNSPCLKSTKELCIPLQDLLFSKQFCMFIIEPIEQKIVFSSESACKLYQYTCEEFMNIPILFFRYCSMAKFALCFPCQNFIEENTLCYSSLKKR
jgi:hypothetical protein